MLKHAIDNWKTTSVGLTMAIGAIIHLVYQITAHTSSENTWTIAVGAIIGGLGLIFAGDAGTSIQRSDVKTDTETGFLVKTDTAPPEVKPDSK